MKKKIAGVLILILFLSSCDSNEMIQDAQSSRVQKILDSARNLSKNHDFWVDQMLSEENQMLLELKKSDFSLEPGFSDYLSVIEKVTGSRPYYKGEIVQPDGPFNISQNSELPVINFDSLSINLADFAPSVSTQGYLQKLDLIMQDSMISGVEKSKLIDDFELLVMTDQLLNDQELTSLLNASSIAKGSISLWSAQFSADKSQKIIGLSKVNPLSKWSYWSKLGFVVAADAVGGVLGLWLGGYVVVNGVPLYVPPGATGVAASAAGLSYIAAKMVGW